MSSSALTSFFGSKAAPAKRKSERAFYSGFLTLVSGTLGCNPRFKCDTCEHEMTSVARAAIHLQAVDPDGSTKICPNITDEDAAECARIYQPKKKPPATPPSGTSDTTPSLAKRIITGTMKPIADKLCARFIFMCMLPFALVEKVYFKNFVSDGLRCVYTFPTRKRLAGNLLDTGHLAVQQRVYDMISYANYVQFSSDGWSNIRSEAIVSYVLTCSKGDYYIDSTDASLVEKKSAPWCFEDFKRIVGLSKIPFEKFSGLITDTENKMRAMWRLVEAAYPKIFAYGCGTHTVQLILKDVCGLPWFANVCKKCNQMSKWFRNHHLPAGILKKTCECLKLKVREHFGALFCCVTVVD